ncbi:hypothetical protein EW146_g7058 [Bondarzewia mesenterica]|uniref:Uncharacterized protein n=1 Tax=Bondarzewia mesenterica TaxID=1095465 RepID=A0A4S4LM18_9AGAM|nr:hypothetical protein EW146_g7058 [Bondarzewia mesenterica]
MSNGAYTPVIKNSPKFIFSSSAPSLFSPAHFFISVHLNLPNHAPITTYTLVDSGVQTSCISEHFATQHSLPRHLKDVPTPIMMVDDHPIASGLITQDIITPLSVIPSSSDSTGLSDTTLASIGLRQTSPSIAGLTQTHPVTVRAKGFGLTPNLLRPHLDSTTAVSIGFGLADATHTTVTSLKTSTPSSDTLATAEPTDTITTTPSFLSSLTRWTGYGHSLPPLTPPPPKANICTISRSKFCKAWHADPDAVCLICMLPTGSPAYISAMTTSLIDDLDDDAPSSDERINAIPRKYADYADTVFAPSEFDKLLPHRNFDMDIELEEGKSPPFGPLYQLTPLECEVLAEHINANLK